MTIVSYNAQFLFVSKIKFHIKETFEYITSQVILQRLLDLLWCVYKYVLGECKKNPNKPEGPSVYIAKSCLETVDKHIFDYKYMHVSQKCLNRSQYFKFE